jgi:parallel beta-helix repeat protein
MAASNIYEYYNGNETAFPVQGTSASAPLWAGFAALANEYAAINGRSSIGFINPAIYAIGKGPLYGSAFNDVTAGDNMWELNDVTPVTYSDPYFSTTTGYDLCAGWGSPKGQTLISLLSAIVWSGTQTISSSYTVPSGQTLIILPGTTLNFASGATMTVNGTLIVNGGTSASPVTFNFAAANQNITIASGGSMQVAPGATLNFSNNTCLWVNGTLNAVGASANPITFNFSGGGQILLSGSGSSSSSLQYATINNAYYGVRFTTGANGAIQNCILNNCTYGVDIEDSSPHVLNNQIINPSTGFIVTYGSSNPVISGNTFAYQGNGPTLSGTVNITSDLTVNAGATLTIMPGTTINFASGTTMTVNGTLFVNGGNSVSPVTFNYTDAGQNLYIQGGGSMQVAPGATLNFLNASSMSVTGTLTTVGTPSDRITFNFGGVGYIQLYGSGTSSSILQYATINNAWNGILFTMDANGTIQNCILNNNKYGVYIYYSSPQVLNNQIVNPSIEGIHIDGSSSNPVVSGNTITYQNNGSTWSGTVNITSNYTVNSGATLTIQPGTTINFASGTTMTVNGTLQVNGGSPVTFNYTDAGQNLYIQGGGSMQVAPGATLNFLNASSMSVTGTLTAVGTLSNRITFNFGGVGYIQFYGSGTSSSMLQYATINNAWNGILFTMGANGSIQNSILNNNQYGVYIYNSSPQVVNNQINNPSVDGIYIDASGSTPNINGNHIKSTTGSSSIGIFATNNNTPYISQNQIGGFVYGIYIGGGSLAWFTEAGYYTPYPNNLITGNSLGLTASWGGTINGGNYTVGGNNSVYNNTNYDAYSYSSGILYADYDYWGSSPKRSWNYNSQLYFDYPISTDPWGGITPSVKQENNSPKGDKVASCCSRQ